MKLKVYNFPVSSELDQARLDNAVEIGHALMKRTPAPQAKLAGLFSLRTAGTTKESMSRSTSDKAKASLLSRYAAKVFGLPRRQSPLHHAQEGSLKTGEDPGTLIEAFSSAPRSPNTSNLVTRTPAPRRPLKSLERQKALARLSDRPSDVPPKRPTKSPERQKAPGGLADASPSSVRSGRGGSNERVAEEKPQRAVRVVKVPPKKFTVKDRGGSNERVAETKRQRVRRVKVPPSLLKETTVKEAKKKNDWPLHPGIVNAALLPERKRVKLTSTLKKDYSPSSPSPLQYAHLPVEN